MLVPAAPGATAVTVSELFPFHVYFSNAPQPLFPEAATLAEAREIAHGCFHGHLTELFAQLAEMRGTVESACAIDAGVR